ncbi:MAG: hypothetical protein JWO89_2262, partial [Verrucomicrobiaceae bacterium]|nr:hypothetical protein [Verrucomicrobiaceae bacterium]
AETIRRQGIFAEVVCAFWKEEPSMTEVYSMVDSREIYLVPNFISEGYFCQEVLPRELKVTGPVTPLGDRTLYYCDPVGVHPNMTRLLLQRADEVAPGVPRRQTSLIIVGHGTNLNENSTKAIKDQVELIRNGGYGFAEVIDAYMEEPPLVNDWHTLTTSPHVVVVPFFIADGLHSFQDIPVLLGIEAETGAAASQRDVFWHNPHYLHDRKLYYSSAIGTEPHLADVILDQVMDFDAKFLPSPVEPGSPTIIPWLEQKAAYGLTIGQVRVKKEDEGYLLCHLEDIAALDFIAVQHGSEAAREIAQLDAAGAFRPLKSAPNLKRGWAVHVADVQALRLALDHLYPAALGLAIQEEQGTLQPVPLRANLGRQTGMYRFTNTISDDQAVDMVGKGCDYNSKCLRRITWGLTKEQPLYGPAVAKTLPLEGADVPLLCVEVCPLIVGQARKIAQANHAAKAGKE